MKIIATIEARLGSKRLKEKLLLPIGNLKLIEFLILRLKKSKLIDQIVLATTNKKIDKKLVNIAKKKNINYFTGSEKNVLERVYKAAKKFDAEIIVQVSGDSPLTDPELIDRWIKIFIKNKPDILSEGWDNLPSGVTAPIINVNALKDSIKYTKNKKDLEHVTRFIFRNPKLFKIQKYVSKKYERYPNLQLCIDEFEDYLLVKNLINKIKIKKLNLKNIISFIRQNHKLLKLNNSVKRKSIKEHNLYKIKHYENSH